MTNFKRCLILFLYGISCMPAAFSQPQVRYVDILITHTTVIDVVNKLILADKTIAISAGKIENILDTDKGYTSGKIIDGRNMIALPGFIDTHTHLWQHICKSCATKERLQTWIKIYNDAHYLDKQQVYDVVLAACGEAFLSGITAVSDYSMAFNDYTLDAYMQALHDAGMGGAIVYDNPSVFIPDSIKLKEIPLLQEKYKNDFSIWMGYGPLSFYPLPQVYAGIALGNKLHMSFSEHTMENNGEQRDFYDALKKYYITNSTRLSAGDAAIIKNLLGYERPSNVDAYETLVDLKVRLLREDSVLKAQHDSTYTPLSAAELNSLNSIRTPRLISPLVLLDYLNGLHQFIAIHGVWPQMEDLAIMKKNQATVSHNPESNLYLTSGLAPLDEYFKAGIPVSLGTDGAASNDGINMFTAMREMWNVYKIKLMNTSISRHIEDWDILRSATINGAIALGIQDKTGSLEKGKNADIVLVATDELGLSPRRDSKLISLLIYSADTRNVKYVISRGKFVVEGGALVKWGETTLSEILTEIAQSADETAKNGKVWAEDLPINTKSLHSYFYRYRSIRKQDSIQLIITNQLDHPVKLTVASSGAVFGGGLPAVADPAVLARFPLDSPPSSFKDQFQLAPGEVRTIVKHPTHMAADKTFSYFITEAGKQTERKTSNGQLLVLVEDK